MNHMQFKDVEGRGGSWILILDCPWPERHVLTDPDSGSTGPSFAECAGCEYQKGLNIEIQDQETLVSCRHFRSDCSVGLSSFQRTLRLKKAEDKLY